MTFEHTPYPILLGNSVVKIQVRCSTNNQLFTGLDGRDGSSGATGLPGRDGRPGEAGATGPRGFIGFSGATGVFVFIFRVLLH